MDPNAALTEIREITSKVLNTDISKHETTDLLWRLAELTNALDEWLSRGGFKPDAWH